MTIDALLLILIVSATAVLFVDPFATSSTPADDELFFPPLADSSDISYFFGNYDLDGLHWALTNIFARSARNPNVSKELPQELVARGGGVTYTSEYKLKHDLAQAQYLLKYFKSKDPERAVYFESKVIPIYEKVLANIPPLDKLEKTKGLYAFTKEDYSLGIADVYNKGLFMTTADELDPNWRQHELLNEQLDFDAIQKEWFGDNAAGYSNEEMSTAASSPIPGVVVIDNLLDQRTLSLIRELLLKNTWWYQTKTPLEFGKYVGSYIDDGMHDPVLLELAKELHTKMPRIMNGHHLKYMWAYKYDSEWESGINLHADEAAVNVNIWISTEGADLQEDDYGGGLVVYTAKPKLSWDFQSYNTNTDFVRKELLEPSNFANVTVKHQPNRCVMFDSALFHQTDKYRFKNGYENGRINLTLLFGEMKKGTSKEEL
mmetsp:Transcript_17494/g.29633  ORF Transcript_17494/g.29633 Transcript_17494/m.29633 type:complete len:431 (+) Transcript_17494:61-1353(+)